MIGCPPCWLPFARFWTSKKKSWLLRYITWTTMSISMSVGEFNLFCGLLISAKLYDIAGKWIFSLIEWLVSIQVTQYFYQIIFITSFYNQDKVYLMEYIDFFFVELLFISIKVKKEKKSDGHNEQGNRTYNSCCLLPAYGQHCTSFIIRE